jgi:hypothetical protein
MIFDLTERHILNNARVASPAPLSKALFKMHWLREHIDQLQPSDIQILGAGNVKNYNLDLRQCINLTMLFNAISNPPSNSIILP